MIAGRLKTFCCASAVAATVASPALAGSAGDAEAQIETLLNFRGSTALGINTLNASVEGCLFSVAFTGVEEGVPTSGMIMGDLNDLSGEDITLRPTETFQELYFLLPEASADWVITIDLIPADPLYDTLIADPNALPHVASDCDANGCQITFDLGGDWDTYEMNVDLTDIVTRENANRLLASFQNLANLCNGHVE